MFVQFEFVEQNPHQFPVDNCLALIEPLSEHVGKCGCCAFGVEDQFLVQEVYFQLELLAATMLQEVNCLSNVEHYLRVVHPRDIRDILFNQSILPLPKVLGSSLWLFSDKELVVGIKELASTNPELDELEKGLNDMNQHSVEEFHQMGVPMGTIRVYNGDYLSSSEREDSLGENGQPLHSL